MGEIVNGKILSLEDTIRLSPLIQSAYRDVIVDLFRRNYSQSNSQPNIYSAGLEIEGTIVDDQLQLAPKFDELQTALLQSAPHLNPKPELARSNIEVETDGKNLFNLQTPLSEVVAWAEATYNSLRSAVSGLDVVLVGAHPSLNLDYLTENLNNSNGRFKAIQERIGRYALPVEIPFIDNSIKIVKGYPLDAYGTTIQNTHLVSKDLIEKYHDADQILGPLMVAANANSPAYDNRLTKWNSFRFRALDPSSYGYPIEELNKGRPGRFGNVMPLSTSPKDDKWKQWADLEMYNQLQKYTSEGVARYFAVLAGHGHPILEEGVAKAYGILPINGTPVTKGDFPQAFAWPLGKIQYKHLDKEKVGYESRYGEMPLPGELASYEMFRLAATQGMVRAMLNEEINPLSKEEVKKNLSICSFYSPNNHKQINFQGKKRDLPEVMKYIGQLAVAELERYEKPISEIEAIVNPVLNKYGVKYSSGGFQEMSSLDPNPAELMRSRAIYTQPNVGEGKPMKPETVEYALEPFKV